MPEIPEDPIQCFQTDAFQNARTEFLRKYRRSLGLRNVLSYLRQPHARFSHLLTLARLFLQANGGNVEFTLKTPRTCPHPECPSDEPSIQMFIHRHLWLPEHSTLPRISPLKIPDATTENILSTIDPEFRIAVYRFAFSQAYRNLYQQYDLALAGTGVDNTESAPALYDRIAQLHDQYDHLHDHHRNE